MTVELVQLDIAHDGCGAATCGINMEVRFAVPPASGISVNPQWDDPTGQVVYDIESGSDYLTIKPMHLGGYRMALRWIGKAYGGVRLAPPISRTSTRSPISRPVLRHHARNSTTCINWHASGAYAGSLWRERGALVCQPACRAGDDPLEQPRLALQRRQGRQQPRRATATPELVSGLAARHVLCRRRGGA